jgi:hypothetical protein
MEKIFNKIEYPFIIIIITILNKLGIVRKFLNLIKCIHEQPTINTIHNVKRLKTLLSLLQHYTGGSGGGN